MPNFKELHSTLVDPTLRDAAEDAVDFAAEAIGLDTLPRIRWFSPSNDWYAKRVDVDGRESGFVEPYVTGEMWVRADLSVEEAIKTVFHECAHLHPVRKSEESARYYEERLWRFLWQD